MGDQDLIRILAKLPPVKWPPAINRFPVLAAYSKLPRPAVADADHAAELIGVRRRMFYHLLHSYRDLASPHSAAHVQANSRALHPVTLRIVEETIADIGFTASEAEIVRSVQQQCTAAGLPAHSEGIVRTRLGRLRHKDLSRRLNVSADLILDACALEIDSFHEQRGITAAGFTAVVEVATGAILSHEVTPGSPSVEVSCRCLRKALERSSGWVRTVRQTSNVATIDAEGLADCGVEADASASRFVKGGTPLTVALGPRLGRIPLRPLNKAYAPSLSGSVVALWKISEVVGFLVKGHNQETSHSAKCPTSKRSEPSSRGQHLESASRPDQGRGRTTG